MFINFVIPQTQVISSFKDIIKDTTNTSNFKFKKNKRGKNTFSTYQNHVNERDKKK